MPLHRRSIEERMLEFLEKVERNSGNAKSRLCKYAGIRTGECNLIVAFLIREGLVEAKLGREGKKGVPAVLVRITEKGKRWLRSVRWIKVREGLD
jgi:predicted transcriptional regulator